MRGNICVRAFRGAHVATAGVVGYVKGVQRRKRGLCGGLQRRELEQQGAMETSSTQGETGLCPPLRDVDMIMPSYLARSASTLAAQDVLVVSCREDANTPSLPLCPCSPAPPPATYDP